MNSSRIARQTPPQRHHSRPIPISPPSAEFGNFTAITDGDVPTGALLDGCAQDLISARVTSRGDVRRCDDIQEGCVVAAFLADVCVQVDSRHAREPR